MSNQVILVLDRELANGLHDAATADEALTAIEHEVVAALEVDPETRIEHIARAIYGAFLSDHGKSPDTHDSMWRVVCTKKDQYRRQAQAALSALCENPGQERGLVDGASPTPVGHEEPGVETGSGEDENCE